jgi:GxxExxY protein
VRIGPDVEQLASAVVDSAFCVHRELGPGLLETAYEACLSRELELRGVKHQRQLPVPLEYKGIRIEIGYRADVVVEEKLLIELKAVEELLPIHTAQVVTYLRLKRFPLGLLINFNVVLIKDGIHRVLNVPRTPKETFAYLLCYFVVKHLYEPFSHRRSGFYLVEFDPAHHWEAGDQEIGQLGLPDVRGASGEPGDRKQGSEVRF